MMKNAAKKDAGTKRLVAYMLAIALISSAMTGAVFSFFIMQSVDNKIASIAGGQTNQLVFNTSNQENLIEAIVQDSEQSIVHVKVSGTRIVPGIFSNQAERFSASGSGFVFSGSGYIMTNNHVIEDASNITVVFQKGGQVAAKLVGTDPLTDVAVLKVNAPTAPIKLGDSGTLRVGQTAIAIGNPLGLSDTVTVGVISGLDREITTAEDFHLTGIIQTDAAINPGNSGGPLLNSNGEVIGITSAKLSGILPSGAVPEGVGFAIPINAAKKIADDLVKNGRVIRPGLGITVVELSSQMAQQLGITTTTGVLIISIVPSGPADNAGLMGTKGNPNMPGFVLGDIITGVDGKPVTDLQSLRNTLFNLRVGQKVEVKYMRDGREKTTILVLQELSGK